MKGYTFTIIYLHPLNIHYQENEMYRKVFIKVEWTDHKYPFMYSFLETKYQSSSSLLSILFTSLFWPTRAGTLEPGGTGPGVLFPAPSPRPQSCRSHVMILSLDNKLSTTKSSNKNGFTLTLYSFHTNIFSEDLNSDF